MAFNEDDFLLISGIQHFRFCRRQWALIHVEDQWAENVRTVEGEALHRKAHDATNGPSPHGEGGLKFFTSFPARWETHVPPPTGRVD